jgi:hypothetical protein
VPSLIRAKRTSRRHTACAYYIAWQLVSNFSNFQFLQSLPSVPLRQRQRAWEVLLLLPHPSLVASGFSSMGYEDKEVRRSDRQSWGMLL